MLERLSVIFTQPFTHLIGPVIEVAVLTVILYFAFTFLEGSSGEGVLRGFFVAALAIAALVFLASRMAGFERLSFVLEKLLALSFIAIVVIFQPEIRRGLVRLGESPLLRFISTSGHPVVQEVTKAVSTMSQRKIGALIAIERNVGLASFAEKGTLLGASVTSELLSTIFYPGSALHDGGVIISGDRICAAGCLFPLSENPNLSKTLGTRHRAAVGLTEESDAICVVVSEQTGQISLAVGGDLLQELSASDLSSVLLDLCRKVEEPT